MNRQDAKAAKKGRQRTKSENREPEKTNNEEVPGKNAAITTSGFARLFCLFLAALASWRFHCLQ
jgi:hypothetical protein